MKRKILTFALCAVTAMGLVACGDKKVETPDTSTEVVESTESTESTETEVPEAATYDNAVDALNAVNSKFDEEMLGYMGGGLGDDTVMGAPGTFPLDDAETLKSMLTFPAESVGLVDDAASMMHMMNGNLYTSAAFSVVDKDNITVLEEAILDTVKNNQWMCGFPEQLVIGQVDNYVMYAYGNVDLVATFENGLKEVGQVDFIESLIVTEENTEDIATPEVGTIAEGEPTDGEAFSGEEVVEVDQEAIDDYHEAVENGEVPAESEETGSELEDNETVETEPQA